MLEENSIKELKWKYYEDVCLLLSKFQSLKPLLIKYIPEHKNQIGIIDSHYQNFRRSIRRDEPILQIKTGETLSALKELKELNNIILIELSKKI